MRSNIVTMHGISFSNLILIIILIVSQLLILGQISSCTEPTNSIHTGQTLSKFTNIHSSIASQLPSREPITSLDNNMSNAYDISLEIFLNKEFENNCSLSTLTYNDSNVSGNISKANEVSLEIFLNKKIKYETEHSSNTIGQRNGVSDHPIDNSQDTASEDYMINEFEKTTQIFKTYTRNEQHE